MHPVRRCVTTSGEGQRCITDSPSPRGRRSPQSSGAGVRGCGPRHPQHHSAPHKTPREPFLGIYLCQLVEIIDNPVFSVPHETPRQEHRPCLLFIPHCSPDVLYRIGLVYRLFYYSTSSSAVIGCTAGRTYPGRWACHQLYPLTGRCASGKG
jgi:hypothetical protein